MYVIYMMITIIRTLYKNEKGRSCLGTIENNVKVVIYCVVGISGINAIALGVWVLWYVFITDEEKVGVTYNKMIVRWL